MLNVCAKLTRRQLRRAADETDEAEANENENSLDRSLNLPALVFLNVSSSIGSGIYVLTGIASNSNSGPFTFVSYFLAGITCVLSAFCFAEFAARIKSTSGSSYSFVYYSIGEFLAFLIGWLIFTGSLTSIAATSLTWSSYLDSLTSNRIKNFTTEVLYLKWNSNSVAPFSTYLDLPACLITIFFFLISLRGIHLSTLFNNSLALLNISMLAVISIAGVVYGRIDNLEFGKYANGFDGVIKGASIVMYAFMGFESSSYAINETINPTKNVPASLLISICLITFTYCTSSLALNLMQPFDEVDAHAPYPSAFRSASSFMFVLASLGPLVSLSGALFTSIYSTARIVYTMACDGLLYARLGRVHAHTRVPRSATLVIFVLSFVLIVAIDIRDLIGFTDITGFLIYSTMGVALLMIRYYSPGNNADNFRHFNTSSIDNYTNLLNEEGEEDEEEDRPTTIEDNNQNNHRSTKQKCSLLSLIRNRIFFRTRHNCLFIILLIYMSNIAYFGLLQYFPVIKRELICLIVASNLLLTGLLSLFEQIGESTAHTLSFKVPLVPFVPVLVIMSNTYLMMASEKIEWIVFGITLILGLPVYFFYGLHHSKLNVSDL